MKCLSNICDSQCRIFATAGIGILDRLGCVDYLFGSEWADVEDYSSYATLFLEEPEEYRQILQEQLKRGKSFPKQELSQQESCFLI